MLARLSIAGQDYEADLTTPIDCSIPLQSEKGPNCYFAPPFEATPVVTETFTGSIESGFPVNFYNLRINPHGNGTHTECSGHINPGPLFIGKLFNEYHLAARLITVEPSDLKGDKIITRDMLRDQQQPWPEAVLVRTDPNFDDKLSRNYSGTNPPYFQPEALAFLAASGVNHLLTDLPSVDREDDGGKLFAHHAFWGKGAELRSNCTITELIYVPDEVVDGLYLLNLQVLNIQLDVSPSRPVLFKLQVPRI